MKHFVVFLFLIGMIGFIGIAYACLCDDLTVEQRINQADVVFSGTVRGDTWNFSEDSIAAGFDIKNIWKGSDSFPLIERFLASCLNFESVTSWVIQNLVT